MAHIKTYRGDQIWQMVADDFLRLIVIHKNICILIQILSKFFMMRFYLQRIIIGLGNWPSRHQAIT